MLAFGRFPSSATVRASMKDADPRRKLRKEKETGMLHTINACTKYVVSSAAMVVLVHFHNAESCWALTGSILASFNCKLLKHLINHERPESAPKGDPGMPSSHAQSLAFLSTYAALHLKSIGMSWAITVQALGLFLTWLRVKLGYHTMGQVSVGYLLGLVSATGWYHLGQYALPLILQEQQAFQWACYASALSALLFGILFGRSWLRDLIDLRYGKGKDSGMSHLSRRED